MPGSDVVMRCLRTLKMAVDWKYGGTVGIKNVHGCWLSWAPGGACRCNETELKTEEKWSLYVRSEGPNTYYKFSISSPLFSLWMSRAEDGHVNCRSDIVSATEWLVETHGDLMSFKVASYYLTNEPPTHSRDRQVLADRTAIGYDDKGKSWELFDLVRTTADDDDERVVETDFRIPF